MISSKRFESVDGATNRFLSDFIIQSELHCRVYMYKYNPSCALDTSCNTIVGGVYVRETNAPQSADIVTVDKWDLVDNSIVFYSTPSSGVTIVIEVATTPEEFGDVVALPSVLAAQSYAASAEVSASSATASALSATNSATSATASALSATNSKNSATASALSATNSSTTATIQAGIATTQATSATASALSATNNAASTAADVLSTHADVLLTHADVVLTHADVVITNADVATSTTQAGIATTKAAEAAASALSVNDTNLVHIAGTETITGVKTFSAGIITPNIPLSGVTSYHLLSGSLTLGNSVITAGMATTLYTGNGATQSVVTGVDMATQWGNSATETFGGLVWLKGRSAIGDHVLQDTVRGIGSRISSNLTSANNATTDITLFTSTGFDIGNVGVNTNTQLEVAWNFQTTHRITGTTNHGKTYTCHYNPFTGFTMVKYEGSGLAGHEIPHQLGRKLGFVTVKNLSAVDSWISQYRDNNYMLLNTTAAELSATTVITSISDTAITVGTASLNNATNQIIMYGWANSYFDVQNNLIGNYYTYIDDSGILRMNVHTGASRENVLWQMSKTTLTTGDWDIVDFTRGNTKELNANLSAVESTITANALVRTASPASYLRAQDTSVLNLVATVPTANGIDINGTKVSTIIKNETITGVTLTQGANYVYYSN